MTINEIWALIVNALSTLTIPVSADKDEQQTASSTPTPLPSEFAKYFLFDSTPKQHANNAETMREFRVQVNYFNKAGLINAPDIVGLMEAAGFMTGAIFELPYDSNGGYFGLHMEFSILADR